MTDTWCTDRMKERGSDDWRPKITDEGKYYDQHYISHSDLLWYIYVVSIISKDFNKMLLKSLAVSIIKKKKQLLPGESKQSGIWI